MNFSKIKSLYHYNKNYGFSKECIEAAQKKWGSLPKVLIEYYLQLGQYEDLNHAQENLVLPNELFEYDGYMMFFSENQESIHWGVSKKDLHIDNPPVYCRKWKNGKYVYLLEHDTMTSFFNAMAFSQALFSLEYNNEGFENIGIEEVTSIKKLFKKEEFGFQYSPKIEFYTLYEDDVVCIVEDNGQYELGYASFQEEHFEEIEELIRNI